MRNAMPFLVAVALAAVFTSGCAGPEQKLGRGINNMFEPARMGELRRSVEQTTVFDSPNVGYTAGFIHGFDRTVERTTLGLVEVATFPLPPYQPMFTRYVNNRQMIPGPGPAYPESYKPGRVSEGVFDTDTFMGFSGGDVAPFIPGSRFSVFSN
jgi:putative exosortase-associated protein (TIGR04073 family)